MEIKGRLTALLLAIFALMAMSCAASLWQLRQMSRALDSLYADRLVPMQQLRRVQQSMGADTLSLVARILEGDEITRLHQDLSTLVQATRRDWDDYKHTLLVERERQLVARAEPLLARLLAQTDSLASLPRGEALSQAAQALARELRVVNHPLPKVLNELIDVQLTVARQESEAGQEAFARSAWLSLALLLCAVGFGATLAYGLWRRYAEEQGHAVNRQLRLQRFYKALSETNQLIVRGAPDDASLYAGLCRICVETGHASLAGVILLEGSEFQRVAVHGPAELLMPGVPQRWALQSRFASSSLSTQAISQDRHIISNRALQDPQLMQASAPLIPPGVEAMAAFVLRRGGKPIGALSLLAPDPDFFDEELVALLDEMVSDLSFALDNLDREQARSLAYAEASESRSLFAALFHASPVSAVLLRAEDGHVLELNERICQRYGLPRETLLGKRMSSLGVGLVPTDLARFYAAMKESGQVRGMEVQARSSDGRLLHSLLDAVRLDYQGQACILATSVDITELRSAQRAARDQAADPAASPELPDPCI